MNATPRFSAAAVVFIALAAGCTQRVPVTPSEFANGKRPRDVWVTRADGSVVHVYRPTIQGDTLLGFVNGRYRRVGLLRGSHLSPLTNDSTRTGASPGRDEL